MDDVSALQGLYQEVDFTELILRRIANAPHPLTLADVRMADDGEATLNPLTTAAQLAGLCHDGILESWDDPYPKCIKTRGHCPPQPVYSITPSGKQLLSEYAANTKN